MLGGFLFLGGGAPVLYTTYGEAQCPGVLVPATHSQRRHSLTSQVSQRPQHASVVTRSPLQPGFLARKVNSRTAQPMKVRRSMAEVWSTTPQPASSRRSTAPRIWWWSFILRQKGEKQRGGRASTVQVQMYRLSSSWDCPSSPQTCYCPSSFYTREDGQM